MSDHNPERGSPADEPGSESDVPGEDREAAMMREVMRRQEQHREGGVDPGLDDADGAAEPDA